MTIRDWINRLLDSTLVFSFDRSGFKRHCPIPFEMIDLSGRHGIVTGASSGIGFAAATALLQHGMDCELIGRNRKKLESSFSTTFCPSCHSLDMSDLNRVYAFAQNEVKAPIDLLIHNAGTMPLSLTINKDGYEEMFACQVLGPFILTKALADLGKLREGCRIVFVSSGGMYAKKLDLSDLLFEKSSYNKYQGYANAKRAQVILSEIFSRNYPNFLFSAMHPGWADTPGVGYSMPLFKKLLNRRLRSAEEGADTILWLATTREYPSGKFWFDRKQAKTTILGRNQTSPKEAESLWTYCESIYNLVKGFSS